MQWISLLASFLIGKLNTSHRSSLKEFAFAIIEEATFKSRKPIALLLGGLGCVLILCGGFFMGAIDLTQQYDREGIIRFTASLGTGIALVAITLGVFAWIFIAAWPGASALSKEKLKESTPKVATSSLEQALATLVLDFVKEREQKRERTYHPAPTTPKEKDSPPLYN